MRMKDFFNLGGVGKRREVCFFEEKYEDVKDGCSIGCRGVYI